MRASIATCSPWFSSSRTVIVQPLIVSGSVMAFGTTIADSDIDSPSDQRPERCRQPRALHFDLEDRERPEPDRLLHPWRLEQQRRLFEAQRIGRLEQLRAQRPGAPAAFVADRR